MISADVVYRAGASCIPVGGVKNFIASRLKDVTLAAMPASFGQTLAAAREQRGLSIEDAAHETRIPVQRLRLLEAGNFAGFGSMTYARSFVRAYSEFLSVDCAAIIEELPEGALGGEHDYRYLTRSQGAWLRERAAYSERVSTPAASNHVRTIKSPLPAAIAVFVLILAGTAMWGKHVAESRQSVEPAAMKALPVLDEDPAPPAARQVRQTESPVTVRKATPVD